MINRGTIRVLGGLGPVVLLLGVAPVAGQDLRTSLSEADAAEATVSIQEMREAPRGPYLRIQWYCADGSNHPAPGTPCRTRGGGVQHAAPSETARRLAELGIYTGTILQGLDFETFRDASNDHHRLKAYVFEQYLSQVDDGWVLRRARYYRGARQIEDEQRQGQAFLERLFADPDWMRRHFLLASQLAAVVPHATPIGPVSTTTIRNLATELANQNERFQPLRVKIHSFPTRDDLAAVEDALSSDVHPAPVRQTLQRLRDELRNQYAPDLFARQLSTFKNLEVALAQDIDAVQQTDSLDAISSLASTLHAEITSSTDGRRNLRLIDLAQALHGRAFVLAQREPAADASHGQRLGELVPLISLARTAGYLSYREEDTLTSEIRSLQRAVTIFVLDYKARLDYLSSGVDWAVATANQTFGPSARRYASVEPKAGGFIDGIVRGSILLSLSSRLDALERELGQLLGRAHHVFGDRVTPGIAGLNPGVARRPLRILEPGTRRPTFDTSAIYVLPELLSEIGPVAGVLTLDQGNLLSHVQLLARNLGIPNASIPSSLLPSLEGHRDREVFFAVSPLGLVRLKDPTQLTDDERALIEDSRAVKAERVAVSTSRLRLDLTQPIPLSELRAAAAGTTVGPKAAMLGELAHLFPGQVAPGVALPFGMYVQHVDRPFESGPSLHAEIQTTLRRADALRAQGHRESEIEQITLDQLAELRRAVVDLPWIPEMRQAIVTAMRESFDGDLGRGVFIRSDTNVEDLPQFTGAGLNLTVPHQTTEESILDAIKAVWASPLRERSFRWRAQILSNQEHVYPSVLLLRSVPADKSGVLITSALQGDDRDSLTIATGEGVGGAVDGEPAETLVVEASGRIRLLSQAKAPYYRVLSDDGTGGVRWVTSSRTERLLADHEIAALRRTIDQWRRGLPPSAQSVIWDMEFGFAGNRLWLFQIRPFVPYRSLELRQKLSRLDDELMRQADRMIDLRDVYETR